MSKISVIIPVYNSQEYLFACLDSVINQTYQNIEIICINDASTDKSLQILKDFSQKDNRIKIISYENNRGQGYARNIGMENASGEYIFFLDSDDSIKLDILEKLLSVAKGDSADITISKTHVFTKCFGNKKLKERVKIIDKYLSFKAFRNYQISLNNMHEAIEKISCIPWGRLFLRNFIEKKQLRFVEKKIPHEDDGFFLKCISCMPKISAIDNIGILYLVHDSSTVAKAWRKKNINKRKNYMLQSIDDAFNYINEHNDKEFTKNFINIVKTSRIYARYFEAVKYYTSFIKIIRNPRLVRIKFLGITIYKKLNLLRKA